jgi:hypothetical protein
MSSLEGQVYCSGDENEMLFWKVERLWELARDLPVETIPLEELAYVLDSDHWFGGDKPTCRAVARHAKLIYEADLSHPLILSYKGSVMDGAHRLAKAWLLGMKAIQVVRFPEDPAPDRRRTKDGAARGDAEG